MKNLFDDFFMAEFFTYCESKSIIQVIFKKMQSPESRDTSPNNGFLSLNGFVKLVMKLCIGYENVYLKTIHPEDITACAILSSVSEPVSDDIFAYFCHRL